MPRKTKPYTWQQARRDHNRAVKERWRAERLEQEERWRADQEATKKRMEELATTGKVTNQNPTKLSTKLFAWGIDSEKHPTVTMGVFPMIFMWLFIVPVLAILYKLSFSWVPVVLIVGAASAVSFFRWIKRK